MTHKEARAAGERKILMRLAMAVRHSATEPIHGTINGGICAFCCGYGQRLHTPDCLWLAAR